jgi:adenine-specific DNA-methyltransferase
MARLDDLVTRVKDPQVRKELEDALAEMKRRRRFGLVYEEHIPEVSALHGFPVQLGSLVQRRDLPDDDSLYRVTALNSYGKTTLVSLDGDDELSVPHKSLLVVKRFGDPIYPTLTPVGAVRRGAAKPYHALINGENFHALQLLVYLFEHQVDCIYVDPPYNTGARDWKYNNRYVDVADAWRHSKWLSMMEKRLRLAKRLLKKDGVLIVTIDEHEVHHLGMLLEKLFPEYLRYMVTIVNNPKGTGKANFGRVDEYAFFIVPDLGYDVIPEMPEELAPEGRIIPVTSRRWFEDSAENEGDETDDSGESEAGKADVNDDDDLWEYRHARRRGAESSYRHQRPNQFYPIYIDEKAQKVIRAGPSIPFDSKPDFTQVDGLRPVWPIDAEGRDRCWAFVRESMQALIDAGDVILRTYNSKRDSWTVNYRVPRKKTRKLKNVWVKKEYDAGTHGTELLRRLLGEPGLFQFPKSVYAVRDCLAAVVRNRPKALIVDFFAGSATTFHAACLLNVEDGGSRSTVLVTNNEVSQDEAKQLNARGLFRGDPGFEERGIFELVARPRCEAVATGLRPDGTPIPGKHLDPWGRSGGRPFEDGFEENIEFYRLQYLDPDDVDLRRQFKSILPGLWLAAGGKGERDDSPKGTDFTIPKNSTYGVLFRESQFQRFRKALERRPEVTNVWIVTDSEDALAEMRSELASGIRVSMLYHDYLHSFRINTR